MNSLKRRLVWAFSLMTLFLLGAVTILAAEEGEVLFEQPKDVVLAWAQRACLAVTILSVVLILGILYWRNRRLMEASSKWLLFLGLCVLPLPVALLSSGIGMEGSKEVEFCHSCHASMDDFVNDMMNPESDTLAAIHFKNKFIQREQCWTCHSDYGIAGTADAKMTGLLHIYKYTFHGALPGSGWEKPIKLYGTYKWTICLGCHSQSKRFNDVEDHADVVKGIVDAVREKKDPEIGCTDCHDMAHPAREDRS